MPTITILNHGTSNASGDDLVITRLKSLGVRVMEDRKEGNEGWDHDLDHDPKHAALVRELVAATDRLA